MASIADKPLRGGLREMISGQDCDLLLTLGDIERFEDVWRGIIAVQEDMHLPGRSPKTREVADLLTLALSADSKPENLRGRFLSSTEATELVEANLPADAPRQLKIARALVAVTFEPDLYDRLDDDGEGGEIDQGSDDAGKHPGDG